MKKGAINLHSPLEEFVIRKCGDDLAYVDNRRDAKQKYGFDFWRNLSVDRLKVQGIEKEIVVFRVAAVSRLSIQGKKVRGRIHWR